jgi:phage baseplate assembly protein gpV
MHKLINGIKRTIDAQIQQIPQPVFGIVTDYDPSRHMIRAMVMPSNVQTGWLAVGTAMVGPEWGLVAPPAAGQQVVLTPTDGAGDNYVVSAMCYSTQNTPPQPGGNQVVPGEIAIVSKTGTFLHLRTNGDLLVSTTGNLTATVAGNTAITTTGNTAISTTGTTNVTSTGNLTVDSSGNIVVSATGTTTISGSSINLDSTTVIGGNGTSQQLATRNFVYNIFANHTHPGVQTGGGSTGIPTQQPDATSTTSNFQAS